MSEIPYSASTTIPFYGEKGTVTNIRRIGSSLGEKDLNTCNDMLGAEYNVMSTDRNDGNNTRMYRCKIETSPLINEELRTNCCFKRVTRHGSKKRVCSTSFLPQSSQCLDTYRQQCSATDVANNEHCKTWAINNPASAQPQIRSYCTPDKILTDPFCKEMNSRAPQVLGADYGLICNSGANIGTAACQDFCISAEGQGKCDSAMRSYCSTEANKSKPVCACLNDESAAPLCFNPVCQSQGYKTQALLQFATQQCGTYVDCRQSIDPSGNNNSASNNQQILNCVAGGGPMTDDDDGGDNGSGPTRGGPAATNLPGETSPPGAGGPAAKPPTPKATPPPKKDPKDPDDPDDDDTPFTVWDRPGDVFDSVYAKLSAEDATPTTISEDPELYPLYEDGPTLNTMELTATASIIAIVLVFILFFVIKWMVEPSRPRYGSQMPMMMMAPPMMMQQPYYG